MKLDDISNQRHEAWSAVERAALLAKAHSRSENYQAIQSACVRDILGAFDTLGLLPPFPDMRYTLQVEGGYLNGEGEMIVTSPSTEFSSYMVKTVIFEPLKPEG